MSTLAERALQARLSTEYRDNRSAFARAVGVSAQAIQHIEEGRTLNLNGKTLEGYVRVTGHSVSWLQSGKEPKFIGGPTSQPYPLSEGDSRFPISESKAPYLRQISTWDNPDELPADQFVFLPHLDAYLSAGHGGPSTDAIETSDKTTPFRSDWVKSEGWNPRTHYTMRCKGDSMEPTIQDGAPVVIDTSASGKRVQSGRIYAISVDGETYLKRLDKLPNGMVRVRSDNATPMYAPYELAESAINIIGRAVWTPVRL